MDALDAPGTLRRPRPRYVPLSLDAGAATGAAGAVWTFPVTDTAALQQFVAENGDTAISTVIECSLDALPVADVATTVGTAPAGITISVALEDVTNLTAIALTGECADRGSEDCATFGYRITAGRDVLATGPLTLCGLTEARWLLVPEPGSGDGDGNGAGGGVITLCGRYVTPFTYEPGETGVLAFDSGKSYAKGTVVSMGGKFYLAATDIAPGGAVPAARSVDATGTDDATDAAADDGSAVIDSASDGTGEGGGDGAS